MTKKWLAMLLAFVLLIPSEVVFRSPEASALSLFAGGTGTVEDPFLISTPEHLNNVRYKLDQPWYFKLTQNIDLTAYLSSERDGYEIADGWEPIGSLSPQFPGHFDGDGYVITGLRINRPSQNLGGLFGRTDIGSSIKRVGLVDVDVTGSAAVGGLAGTNMGSISDSFVTGKVTASNLYAGGLVGNSAGTITNSYALVTVNSTSTDVGGLVGKVMSTGVGVVSTSFSAGKVTGTTGSTGGLIGVNDGSIEKSYYDIESSHQADTGKGAGKTFTQMLTQATYVDWDFTTVWSIREGDEYPKLRVFDKAPTEPDELPTASPTLSGSANVGSVLTATSGYADADADEESGTTYAFYRYNEDGISGETLAQAASTTNTYTIVTADLGKVIKVKVVPKNAKATGATATSAATDVIAEALPIEIWTAEQLDAIRDNMSGNYILMADINLTSYLSSDGPGYDDGKGWRPIGTTINMFKGHFDGNGHVITGLKINRPNESLIGLFGQIDIGASIKRIGLMNIDMKGKGVVGGLSGASKGNVSESFVTGFIVASGDYVGGLVGLSNGEIENSYAIVTINSTGAEVGGLVGGVVRLGPFEPGVVKTSFSASIVSGAGNTGGLIGSTSGAVNIDNKSFYDKTISGQSDTGRGTGKTTTQLKTQSTFAGWDFEDVWMMNPSTGFPSLRIFVPADALPTAAPTLAGTAQVGSVLTATSGYADADADEESGTTYAFYSYEASGTGNETLVQAESTTNTYIVTVADIGKVIKVKVTPKNAKATGATTTSAATSVVPRLSTTITLTSDRETARVGQTVKLTALVTAADHSLGVPTGSVTFKNGSETLGTAELNEDGEAQWTTTSLPVGTNNALTAEYAGAGDHLGSVSSAVAVRITSQSSGGGAAAPAKEEIKVDVQSGVGTNGAVVAQTVITRTTGADGKKKDEVSLTPEQAEDTVRQLQQGGVRSATLVIPDAKDEVAELNVKLPKASTDKLAGENVGLSIYTNGVHIEIPSGSMQGRAEDTYFRVVPIKQEDERKAVEQRAKTEQAAKLAIGIEGVSVIGRPMTIETNLQNRPVTLVLPLGDAKLTEAQKRDLGVFIEHSDGTKEFVRGELVSYDSSGALGLRIAVNKFSTFTIVHLSGWSAASSAATHSPYIFGYGDGTFKPNSVITRAEVATILVRAFPAKPASATHSFTDVSDKHWARTAIQQAVNAGLLQGYPSNAFKPEQAMTRGEMAKLAAALLGDSKASDAGGVSFSDIQGHWAQAAIERVQAAGILDGYSDGTFRPNDKLTRAQAVIIVNKLLGWQAQGSSEAAKWSDVPATHWAFGAIQQASGEVSQP